MKTNVFPFRVKSAAGDYGCSNGEIDSAVNVSFISTANTNNASDPSSSDWPEEGSSDSEATAINEALVELNRLSSRLLPCVEFSLVPKALAGWQNHPDNPLSATVDAPKSKDAAGWSQRAEETLRKFHEDARQKNLFTEPFFALTALRLKNGRHILPSSPVLMMPSSSAPVVEGSDNFTLDSMTMYIRSAVCSGLRMRITISEELSEWRDRIEAIDVFVSPPLPLYVHDEPLKAVHRAAGSVSPQSWLPQQLTDSEFTARLISTSTFRAISSIPLSQIASDSGSLQAGENKNGVFQDVIFNIPDLSAIPSLSSASLTREMMSYQPDYLQHHGIAARTACSISGRITLADLTLTLPAPPPLASLIPHDASEKAEGEASEALNENVALEIESIKGGETMHAYSWDPARRPVAVTETGFPKWLFIPDADARQLSIITPTGIWTVPLRPHPLLPGAFYWCGAPDNRELSASGVRKVAAAVVLAAEAVVRRDSLHLADAIWRSAKDEPLYFPSVMLMRPKAGKIIALCRAYRASGLVATTSPTAYMFTDRGIFLLKEMDNGELRDAGMIARYILDSPDSIRIAGTTLRFSDVNGRQLVISGTTVKELNTNRSSGPTVEEPNANGTSPTSSSAGPLPGTTVLLKPEDPSIPIKITTRPLKLASLIPQSNDNIFGMFGSLGKLREVMWEVSIIGAISGNLRITFFGSRDLRRWISLSSTVGHRLRVWTVPGMQYGRIEISGTFTGTLEALPIHTP